MYRAFEVQPLQVGTSMRQRGQKINEQNRKCIMEELNRFVDADGLSGIRLMQHWFPQIDSDVFISHSHRDLEKATDLAGWLSTLGLKTFVDSSVWGYMNDLLKEIDDEYCLNPGGRTYDYDKRNGSTSHVHMMLSVALAKMIDNTECVMFLTAGATKG